MTIDPKISEYIDFAIARQGKISDAKFDAVLAKWDAKFKEDRDIARADSERHMGMLLEQFQDRLQLVKEWVKDLPTRDEVRTMIQDETNPIRRDIAMFKIELINLRRESDLRLTRLEHKIA